MDLNRWLAQLAARRAHVFIAEIPGNWALRAATQDLIAARGWRQACSPADADVLAVCGAAGDELVELIDRIWDQLPGPRARLEIRDVLSASDELDRAAGALIDVGRQRADAAGRPRSAAQVGHCGDDSEDHQMLSSPAEHGAPAAGTPSEAHDGGYPHMDHGGGAPHDSPAQHPAQESHDHGGHAQHGEPAAHAGHDMGQSGHHMDHGDMDMAPAGIALARGGEDRDGLEMDELHVRLGPFLAYWPAGLVLRCALQGDVITAAQAQMMGAANDEKTPSLSGNWIQAARHTDHLVDLLVLAGWPRAAARARRLRGVLLGDAVDSRAARQQADALATAVRRSRVLRWALRDLAPIAADDTGRHGLPAALAGDTYDRLLTRLDVLQRAVRDEADAPRLHMQDSAIDHMLPALVEGLDVATARLVIAGLGIDTPALEMGQHA